MGLSDVGWFEMNSMQLGQDELLGRISRCCCAGVEGLSVEEGEMLPLVNAGLTSLLVEELSEDEALSESGNDAIRPSPSKPAKRGFPDEIRTLCGHSSPLATANQRECAHSSLA